MFYSILDVNVFLHSLLIWLSGLWGKSIFPPVLIRMKSFGQKFIDVGSIQSPALDTVQ